MSQSMKLKSIFSNRLMYLKKYNHVNDSTAQKDQVLQSLVICHILVHYTMCWQISLLCMKSHTHQINLLWAFEHLAAPLWLPCVPMRFQKIHILKQFQGAVICTVNLSKLIFLPYKIWNDSHMCTKIDTAK